MTTKRPSSLLPCCPMDGDPHHIMCPVRRELTEHPDYCENRACCSERGHEGKCDERAAL